MTPENTRKTGYALALILGLAVAAAGYISSFANLATYANKHGFPIGWLLPVGLDLGIPALLLLDWLRPSLFLRSAAWSLAGFTVFANGAVAGGEPTDRLLHAVMPAVAILIVESGRHLKDDPSRMDKVRLSRWLLSPVRTARVKRRMVLWEITSYAEALTRESAILHARTVLMAIYGKRYWATTRRHVPATLKHQIATGQLPFGVLHSTDLQTAVQAWIHQTLTEIATAPSPVALKVTATGHDPEADSEAADPDPWVMIRVAQDSIRPEGIPAELFAAAIGIAERHFAQVGKLPRVDDFRDWLTTGQARASAIRRALQSALDDPSVLADQTNDSATPEPAPTEPLREYGPVAELTPVLNGQLDHAPTAP